MVKLGEYMANVMDGPAAECLYLLLLHFRKRVGKVNNDHVCFAFVYINSAQGFQSFSASWGGRGNIVAN